MSSSMHSIRNCQVNIHGTKELEVKTSYWEDEKRTHTVITFIDKNEVRTEVTMFDASIPMLEDAIKVAKQKDREEGWSI
jgi:hypothetical protein